MTTLETSLNMLGFAQLKNDIWYKKTNKNDFIALELDEVKDLMTIWRCDENGNAPTRKSFNSFAKVTIYLLGQTKIEKRPKRSSLLGSTSYFQKCSINLKHS